LQSPAPPLLRRAFSLSGVVPLGAFLVFHLAVGLRALGGEERLASTLDAIHQSRGFPLLEAMLVYAPLLVHAAIGVSLVVTGETLVERTPYSPAVTAGMRATGTLAAGFLALHVAETRLSAGYAPADGGALTTTLAARLSSTHLGIPWHGVGYLVGAGCVAFHFAVGCWGLYARSAHGQGSSGRRRGAAWLAAVVGTALGLGFADVVVFEATGVRMLGKPPSAQPAQACP
jgi:succinate dehydrogenase / fumarate reductase cytochrome b subunit